MIRTAGPAREVRASAPEDAPAPATARRRETAQDRLGAEGAWEAAAGQDRWSALTELLARMLAGAPAPTPVAAGPAPAPARAPAAPSPPSGPEELTAEPAERVAETAAAEGEDAPARLPESAEARVLGQAEPPPGPGEVAPAEFPEGDEALPEAAAPAAPSPAAPRLAAGGGAAPPSPAAVSGGDPAPRAIVWQWQAGVSQAGAGIPQVLVRVEAAQAATLTRTGSEARRRNTRAREGLTRDAIATVPPAPEIRETPAPPERNPVPQHTRAVLRLSNRRLANQSAPALVASPERDIENGVTVGGQRPQIGDRPIATDLFQTLISPRARELAQLPAPAVSGLLETPEQRSVREAMEMLSGTPREGERRDRGEQVITPDTAPVVAPPLPPGLSTPVGQVVARLLARVPETTTGVLDSLRERAFRGGELKTNFPDIGQAMAPSLQSEVTTELHDIAAAAGVSAEQLDGMVVARQAELTRSATEAAGEAEAQRTAAAETVQDEGQQTADAIAGAARAAEDETLNRQEAASGQNDPAVINRRRELVVSWIREQVTTQITDYQRAGDNRVRELNTVREQQLDAYRAQVQREVYKVMTPQAPRPDRDTADTARERRMADLSTAIRGWGHERVRLTTEEFRERIDTAQTITRTHRSQIESAGSVGIEAARSWAEDKILAGQGWWDRFIARIRRWLSEANDVTEQWRVRRTTENRNAVAADIQTVRMAREALARGLTQEQILADRSLSAAQRSMLQAYFAQGPDTHPLDFAARRLRDSIATDHLERARQIFERELIAMPVSGGDYSTANKLEAVARAQTGSFSAAIIAQQLRAAMDQIGTDEPQIYRALGGLTALQGAVVRKMYRARYDRNLDEDLRDELSGDEEARAFAQIEGRQAEGDAIALHDAVAGLGTDEAAIMEMLRNKTPAEVAAIRAAYLQRYGESLDDALRDDLDEGNERDQADALVRGDVATADAIALDEAMRGGLTGWGTSEEEVERVYTRTRSEVLAMAQRENWTAEEMEAEVRRRLGAIEARFGERYADVEQYNRPGLAGGTVLERAFSSELSGPELDLANALQDNNLIAADAARIEIERRGVYASDDAINDVLRSQFERALEARRLDEGTARQMRVRRLVDELRDRRPPLSENEISRQRIALERQMEREMEDGAQQDSRLSMGELRDVYQDRYFWPLSYAVETSMSGEDRNRARNMLQQGGRLTPLQEVEYATRTAGTDEEALRRVLTRMTRDEIQGLREQWERRNPGRSFNAMLRSELTGRDASDIMDAVHHGAPETDEERIQQEERRVHREINHLTGVLGGVAAGNEADWMDSELARLRELRAPLHRTDWPDTPEARAERERLSERVNERVQAVQDAVADHRRRIDAVTDFATQVIGIAVGVTVAVVLGALSGGTLGVATIALMASLMATASTITTKILIKGGAYGIDDYGIDLAVGVVDAITAVATAGMGSRLIRPLQALAQRTRVGDVVGWMGRTGLTRRMAQAPGAATVRGLAGRVGLSREGLERGAAAFLAEGIEDAVGAAPSSFVQIALTDATWEGDPLKNFLESGGMALLQAVAMGRLMAGGMTVGQRGFTGLRGMARSRTEVGRLLEANRILQEGYGRYRQDNPGASIGDFLASRLGRDARAAIERRGLMRDIEATNRAAETPMPAREVQAQPRAGAEAEAPPPSRATADAEARAAALEGAIPQGLREGTFVSPDPGLSGRTVRVEPLRIGERIVGVDVRVGPDATPMDIAMHAATVHAMQRYRGTLGNIRRALVDMAATITGSGLHVGSRGWEARLEMGKLPAIIAERMDALSGRALTPEAEARVLADIASLEAQFHHHESVFADPTLRDQPGRGYVAADAGSGPPPPRPEDLGRPPRRVLYDSDGVATPAGRADLDARLDAARQHFDAARAAGEAGDTAGRLRHERDAMSILRGIEDLHDIPPAEAWARVMDHDLQARATEQSPGPQQAAEADAESATRAEPPESGADYLARQIEVHRQARIEALRAAHEERVRSGTAEGAFDPSLELASIGELVARIATGDAAAQVRLDALSAAPQGYVTRNVTDSELHGLLAGNGIGILRLGTADIQISRSASGDVIYYHGSFPPYSQIGGQVLQLENGALRIWRARPTPDYPDGRLMQESLTGGARTRAGHERIAQLSYSQAELAGPETERAHVMAPSLGPESAFGILHSPKRANQELQRLGVEAYIGALRDASPPGVEVMYITEVRRQGGGVDEITTEVAERLAEIVYRIDIVVNGRRMPFAEYGIGVVRLPEGVDPALVTDPDLVSPDAFAFRAASERSAEAVFDAMQNLVPVPDVVRRNNLARLSPEAEAGSAIALQRIALRSVLMGTPPEAIAAAVAGADPAVIARYRPPGPGGFDAAKMRADLDRAIWAQPRPQTLVVDLRDLALTPQQRDAVVAHIAAQNYTGRERVVLLE